MRALLPVICSLPLLAGLALGLSTCNFNGDYCPGATLDDCRLIDANNTCSASTECAGSPDTPVCDLDGSKTCVQCTVAEAAACVGTAPVCGTDNTCRACSQHSDCASAVCLPDGACGSDVNVAYVAPTGTGTTCTQAAPCKKVDDAFKTSRPFVKFSGVTDEAVVVDAGRQVTFLADPGAKLSRTSGGAIVTVRDTGTSLTIYDLAISDAPNNANGYGVLVPTGSGTPSVSLTRVTLQNNPGGGISASGGTLTVTQSTVSGNQGGGISAMNATFDITNNFIFRNGNSTGTTVGGVNLAVSVAANNRLEFNTIVDNEIANSTTSAGGLTCDIAGFSAANNIIARNFVNRMPGAANANTVGQCLHLTSRVAADLTGLPFVSPDTEPLNYHLAAGSSAIDQATTASTVIVDIDGDSRPQGAQKDIGADEYKAN